MPNDIKLFLEIVKPLNKLYDTGNTYWQYESALDLCYAHHRGYKRVISDLKRYMVVNGYNVSWLTSLIKELEINEEHLFKELTRDSR